MSRPQSPLQEQAKKLWLKSGKTKPLVAIADEIGVSAGMIRKWKHVYNWDAEPIKRRRGAPPGNQNAVGNRGGPGAPEGNDYAVTHGLFRRFMPEALAELAEEIEDKDPIDMLWDMIVIKYTNIMHSQRIMYVRDRDDETMVIKNAEGVIGMPGDEDAGKSVLSKVEYEYQHAWDKQANALKAQAAAMHTLQNMIHRYSSMVSENGTEEQRLRVEKLRAEIDKIKKDDKNKDIKIKVTLPSRPDVNDHAGN